MKKQITLIIGSLFYSLLFYQNTLGLNIVLFSLLSIAVIGIFNLEKLKRKKTAFFASVYFLSSLFFFLNSTALALIANVMSLLVFVGSISEEKASVYIKIFNGFFSTVASKFYHYFNRIYDETIPIKKKEFNYSFWLKIIGIPIIAVTIFVILYRSANPIFDNTLKAIDFSFIDFPWIVFTSLGYFIIANMVSPATVEPITTVDVSTSNLLSENEIKHQSLKNLLQENQLGIVLVSVLNVLITFFLVTDGVYLSQLKDLTASSLSGTVHEGVYALITSILLAISIIIYFFRGNLNFYNKNKTLKTLTIIWIILNILLVISTNYKNYLYTSHYGLTYRRIGVFVYLLLSFFGLITTFFKVQYTYNFFFLIRKNSSLAFAVLILASVINWDMLITKYNTKYAQITDIVYLTELENNSPLLKEYLEENKATLNAHEERLIEVKYAYYIKEISQKKWQEITYDSLKDKS